eukprot:m.141846 g.141846  ORF g.141846 m.141846 type:complete len:104 (+) comp30216_c1_seq1:185-496(+)
MSNPNLVQQYKDAEKAKDYAEVVRLRHLQSQMVPQSDSGHAYYQYQMMIQAQQNNQLNPIGQLLGVGPNPYVGVDPRSPDSTPFQQYTVGSDGKLYLGGKLYN